MTDTTTRRRIAIYLIGIAALILAFYANSLRNGYSVDDYKFVVNNGAVHGFSLQNLQAIFTAVPNGVEYLPVKDLTYCLDFIFAGSEPLGYHLSNLLYYVLCCWALFFFARALLSPSRPDAEPLAFIVTAIYAIHPQHVASVASISQRKDLISGIFLFLSLLFYLKHRSGETSPEKYLLSLLFFFLALLSKATVITIPFAILLLEPFIPEQRRLNLARRIALIVPYLLIVVAFALINNEILKKTGVILPFYSKFLSGYEIRIYTALRAIFYYFKMILIPYPLLMFHQFDFSKAFAEPAVILSLCGLLLLLPAVYLLRRRLPLVTFGVGWCLISLLPVIGLIPSNTLIAERYLFLPVAGFAFAAGAGIKALMDRGRSSRLVAVGAFCLLLAACGGLTAKRNVDWNDNLSLILANIRDIPQKPSLYYLAGVEYFGRGDYPLALSYMKKASEMNSFYSLHHSVYAAIIAYQNNRTREALDILDREKNSFKLYVLEVNYLYGKIHQSLGDRDTAALYYRNAKNSAMPLGVFSAQDVANAMTSLQ